MSSRQQGARARLGARAGPREGKEGSKEGSQRSEDLWGLQGDSAALWHALGSRSARNQRSPFSCAPAAAAQPGVREGGSERGGA